MEIDHPNRTGRRRDGVALLDGLGTDEGQIEQHLIEFALRTFEARHLRRGLEASRHLRCLGEHQLAQLQIRCRGFFPYQLPGRTTQQGHDGGFLPTRNLRQSRQHGFVLRQALATLGFGELVRHEKRLIQP